MRQLISTQGESASKGSFVTGLLVGALMVVLVWGLASAMSSTGPTPTERGPAAPVHDTSRQHRGDPRSGCMRVFEAQIRPLRAANASLDQWRVHVGAMNRLVAGEITLGQATAFWNRTRVGAKRRLALYDAAVRSLSKVGASCPRNNAAGANGQMPCVEAVNARAAELRTASVALGTWRRHVRDMDMLRMGRMTPSHATQMWLRNWQKGVAEIDDYTHAVRAASVTHCE